MTALAAAVPVALPGVLTLAAPINTPNVVKIKPVGKIQDDPDNSELVVTYATFLGGDRHYLDHVLTIHNGDAQGIRAKAAPTGPDDCAETFFTSTGMATAYTQCKAAIASGGRVQLTTVLQTLGLLPAGTIA